MRVKRVLKGDVEVRLVQADRVDHISARVVNGRMAYVLSAAVDSRRIVAHVKWRI